MYRKITEKNEVWNKPRKPPRIVPPHERQSFISCPECYGQSLVHCECDVPNYLCQFCGWTHYTHKHGEPKERVVYEKQPVRLLHPFTLPN